jgi:hypothetical protein
MWCRFAVRQKPDRQDRRLPDKRGTAPWFLSSWRSALRRLQVPYISPPSPGVSGKEALEYIRKVDGCSSSASLKQLKSAISDGEVRARLPDPKDPSQPALFPPWPDPVISMINRAAAVRSGGPVDLKMSNVRFTPTREQWRTASVRVNGTVQFRSGTPWYKFEVARADVMRIWPTVREHPKRTKARPVETGIRKAITALWAGRIPPGLRAKERNEQIAKWLKANGYRSQSQSALARAVQRVLKSAPAKPRQ